MKLQSIRPVRARLVVRLPFFMAGTYRSHTGQSRLRVNFGPERRQVAGLNRAKGRGVWGAAVCRRDVIPVVVSRLQVGAPMDWLSGSTGPERGLASVFDLPLVRADGPARAQAGGEGAPACGLRATGRRFRWGRWAGRHVNSASKLDALQTLRGHQGCAPSAGLPPRRPTCALKRPFAAHEPLHFGQLFSGGME